MEQQNKQLKTKRRGTSALTRLLCCPECGGEAEFVWDDWHDIYLAACKKFHPHSYFGCVMISPGITKEDAAENWNAYVREQTNQLSLKEQAV